MKAITQDHVRRAHRLGLEPTFFAPILEELDRELRDIDRAYIGCQHDPVRVAEYEEHHARLRDQAQATAHEALSRAEEHYRANRVAAARKAAHDHVFHELRERYNERCQREYEATVNPGPSPDL